MTSSSQALGLIGGLNPPCRCVEVRKPQGESTAASTTAYHPTVPLAPARVSPAGLTVVDVVRCDDQYLPAGSTSVTQPHDGI
jgi:hypothetical protein